MGLPAQKHRYSIEEYYRIENDSTEKHEFRDSEILAMAGGSPQHALIAANFISELHVRLKGKPCKPYGGDLRIRVTGRERSVYPDVSVICGEVQLDPDDKAGHTALNPRVIVEVLSPSTETYDRGKKFDAYREIPSLVEYVLVSQSEPRVETFLRREDGTWSFDSFVGLDSLLKVRSLQLEIPLSEIYADIELPPKSGSDDSAVA